MTSPRVSVAVIFGGQNTEHEISCLTAAGVVGAIDSQRFEVYGIAIDRDGVWHRANVDTISAMHSHGDTLPSVDSQLPVAVLTRQGNTTELSTRVGDRLIDSVTIDVALILLHGAYGEDGTIQGYLEMLGVPYVGSGVASSAIGMDKHLMKVAFEAAGLPVGAYQVIMPDQWQTNPARAIERINDRLIYPLFVKPARGGSSVGICKVNEPESLPAAIEHARVYDPKVIVEEAVTNAREVEIGVLGAHAGQIRTSLPGEIVVNAPDAFYDYQRKYLAHGEVDLHIPVQLEPAIENQLRGLARKAFLALGCEGLARVDAFICAQGQVLINEINTMPGFTAYSMFPALWQATGMSYSDLISDLIDQAMSRPRTVVR